MSELITYYLEMHSIEALQAKPALHDMVIQEAQVKNFRLNRFLYQLVGEPWQWTDKLSWSDDAWQEHVERPQVRTWMAMVQGSVAGYFELERDDAGNTEILYFGLAPDFVGKGYGGYLLTEAIRQAWQVENTQRVWVHTCNLDHPSALQNYLARGFKQYDTEVETLP